eukprot:1155051-Pelagomonas_calceolata.AAC.1
MPPMPPFGAWPLFVAAYTTPIASRACSAPQDQLGIELLVHPLLMEVQDEAAIGSCYAIAYVSGIQDKDNSFASPTRQSMQFPQLLLFLSARHSVTVLRGDLQGEFPLPSWGFLNVPSNHQLCLTTAARAARAAESILKHFLINISYSNRKILCSSVLTGCPSYARRASPGST